PVSLLADLFQIQNIEVMEKQDGDPLRKQGSLAAPLTLTLVGHFWTADFFRIFGSGFYTSLIEARIQSCARIIIHAQKVLKFMEVARGLSRYYDPTLEYLEDGNRIHPVRVRYFNTSLPYGKQSLNAHALTFLGAHKSGTLSSKDKEWMLRTFRRKTRKAYG